MITLDRLYRARKAVALPDNSTVLVRALSDAERRQIQTDSLAASMRFDRALKDHNSNEYLCYVYPLESATRDELIEALAQWRRSELMLAAQREFKDEYLPFPDDATLEEMKAVVLQREESEARIKASREAFIEKQIVDERIRLSDKPEDALRVSALKYRAQYVSALEAYAENVRRCVYYSCEKTDGGRAYTFEEVCNLETSVLNKLYTEHKEVDSLDPWEITKMGDGRKPEGMVAAESESLTEPMAVVVGADSQPAHADG